MQTGVANHIHTPGKPLALSTDVSYVVGRSRPWPSGWLDPVTAEAVDEDMPASEDVSMSAEARAVAAAGV